RRPALSANIRRMKSGAIFRASVLLAAFVAISSAALAADPAAATRPPSVTAKLVEIPSKFPPDDLYDYAYVMRYEVQGGPLDKQTILGGHYKPRQARDKIED